MKDPEFAAEWNNLQTERERMRQIVEQRYEESLTQQEQTESSPEKPQN